MVEPDLATDALVNDARLVMSTTAWTTEPDARSAQHWLSLLDERGSEILTRSGYPDHTTASVVVMTPDAAATCLVLHLRYGTWLQAGGHVEAGDTSLSGAAARELLEETGLRATLLPQPLALSRHQVDCRTHSRVWHHDVVHVGVTSQQPTVGSEETCEVAWFPRDHLPKRLNPYTRQLITRAAQQIRCTTELGTTRVL